MVETFRMLLSTTFMVMLLRYFEPVIARPADIEEELLPKLMNNDYDSLQAILGHKLSGTIAEKAKIVDLMLQLLSEIDLPTLCDVIASDSKGNIADFLQTPTKSLKDDATLLTEISSQMKTEIEANSTTLSPVQKLSLNTQEPTLVENMNFNVKKITDAETNISFISPYSKSQETEQVSDRAEEEKLASTSNVYNIIQLKNIQDNRNAIEQIGVTEDLDEAKYTQRLTIPFGTLDHRNKAASEDSVSFNDKHGSQVSTDKDLLHSVIGKRKSSFYDSTFDLAQTPRDLKKMHLRSIYSQLPGDYRINSEDANGDIARHTNGDKNYVGMDKPRSELYANPLILGDWIKDKMTFYVDKEEKNNLLGAENLNTVIVNGEAERPLHRVNDKDTLEKMFVGINSDMNNDENYADDWSQQDTLTPWKSVNTAAQILDQHHNNENVRAQDIVREIYRSEPVQKVLTKTDNVNHNKVSNIFPVNQQDANGMEKVRPYFEAKIEVMEMSNKMDNIFEDNNKTSPVLSEEQHKNTMKTQHEEGVDEKSGLNEENLWISNQPDIRMKHAYLRESASKVNPQQISSNNVALLEKMDSRNIRTLFSAASLQASTLSHGEYALKADTQYREHALTANTNRTQYGKHVLTSDTNTIQYGEHALTSDTNTIQYGEHVLTADTNTTQYGEDVLTADTNTTQYGEHVLTADTNTTQYGEHVLTADTNTTQYGEHVLTADTNTTQYGEHVLTADTNTTQYGEHVLTADTNTTQYGEHVLTADTNTTQYGDHALTADTNTTQYGEHVLTADINTTQYGEHVLTADINRTQYGEYALTADTQYGEHALTVNTNTTQYGEHALTAETNRTQYGEYALTADTQYGEHALTANTNRTQYGEHALTSDTNRTQYGEYALTADTQYGEHALTTNTNRTQYFEHALIADTNRTQYGEHVLTADTNTIPYGEHVLTADTNTTQYGEHALTADTNTTQFGEHALTANTNTTQYGEHALTADTNTTQFGEHALTANTNTTQYGEHALTADTNTTQYGEHALTADTNTTQYGEHALTADTNTSQYGDHAHTSDAKVSKYSEDVKQLFAAAFPFEDIWTNSLESLVSTITDRTADLIDKSTSSEHYKNVSMPLSQVTQELKDFVSPGTSEIYKGAGSVLHRGSEELQTTVYTAREETYNQLEGLLSQHGAAVISSMVEADLNDSNPNPGAAYFDEHPEALRDTSTASVRQQKTNKKYRIQNVDLRKETMPDSKAVDFKATFDKLQNTEQIQESTISDREFLSSNRSRHSSTGDRHTTRKEFTDDNNFKYDVELDMYNAKLGVLDNKTTISPMSQTLQDDSQYFVYETESHENRTLNAIPEVINATVELVLGNIINETEFNPNDLHESEIGKLTNDTRNNNRDVASATSHAADQGLVIYFAENNSSAPLNGTESNIIPTTSDFDQTEDNPLMFSSPTKNDNSSTENEYRAIPFLAVTRSEVSSTAVTAQLPISASTATITHEPIIQKNLNTILPMSILVNVKQSLDDRTITSIKVADDSSYLQAANQTLNIPGATKNPDGHDRILSSSASQTYTGINNRSLTYSHDISTSADLTMEHQGAIQSDRFTMERNEETDNRTHFDHFIKPVLKDNGNARELNTEQDISVTTHASESTQGTAVALNLRVSEKVQVQERVFTYNETERQMKDSKTLLMNKLNKSDLSLPDVTRVITSVADETSRQYNIQDNVSLDTTPNESVLLSRQPPGDVPLRRVSHGSITMDRLKSMASMIADTKANLSKVNLGLLNKFQRKSQYEDQTDSNSSITIAGINSSNSGIVLEDLQLSTFGPENDQHNSFRISNNDKIGGVIKYKNVVSKTAVNDKPITLDIDESYTVAPITSIYESISTNRAPRIQSSVVPSDVSAPDFKDVFSDQLTFSTYDPSTSSTVNSSTLSDPSTLIKTHASITLDSFTPITSTLDSATSASSTLDTSTSTSSTLDPATSTSSKFDSSTSTSSTLDPATLISSTFDSSTSTSSTLDPGTSISSTFDSSTSTSSTLDPATSTSSTLDPATSTSTIFDQSTSSTLNPATSKSSTFDPSTSLNPATSTSSTLNPPTSTSSILDTATSTSSILDPKTSTSSTLDPATSTSSALNPATSTSSTLDPSTSTSSTLNPATSTSNTLDPATSTSSTLDRATSTSSTLNPPTSTSSILDTATSTSSILDPKTSTSSTLDPATSTSSALNPATSTSSTLDPSTSTSSTLNPATSTSNTLDRAISTSSTLNEATSTSNTLDPATSTSTIFDPATSTSNTLNPATSTSNTLDPATSTSSTLDRAISTSSTLNPATSKSSTFDPSTSASRSLDPATSTSSTLNPATSTSSTLDPATSTSSTLDPATSTSSTLDPATSTSSTLNPATSTSTELNPVMPASSTLDASTPASTKLDPATPASSALDPATPTFSTLDPVTPAFSRLDPFTPTSPILDPTTSTSSILNPATPTSSTLDPSTATSSTLDPVISSTLYKSRHSIQDLINKINVAPAHVKYSTDIKPTGLPMSSRGSSLGDHYHEVPDEGHDGYTTMNFFPSSKTEARYSINNIFGDDLQNIGHNRMSQNVEDPSKRPELRPYTFDFSDWFKQEPSQVKPTPFVHPWKAFNIAVSKQKTKRPIYNRFNQLRASDAQLYSHVGFTPIENENRQEDYLWKARPRSENNFHKQSEYLLAEHSGRDQSKDMDMSSTLYYPTTLLHKIHFRNSRLNGEEYDHDSYDQGYTKPVGPLHLQDTATLDSAGGSTLVDLFRASSHVPTNSDFNLHQASGSHSDKIFDPNNDLEYRDTSEDADVYSDKGNSQDILPSDYHSVVYSGLFNGHNEQTAAENAGNEQDVTDRMISLSNMLTMSSESIPAPNEYKCPGLFGYHRDPDNCQAFFVCSWGMPHRLICPAGTLYNPRHAVCDWAVNVECSNSSDKDKLVLF